MKSFQVSSAVALAALAVVANAGIMKKEKRAISSVVTGTPMGFAAATTGGGDATPVYPTTIDELKSYLTSSDPQVIVISGEYNFAGSEGTSTYDACDGYTCPPSEGGQALLNTLSGCGSLSTYSVTIDTAAYQGINVASDKTLVGTNGATMNGKGLRFVNVDNIIVQNIAITNLNPMYVWGGDALAFSGVSNIWIDHVEVSPSVKGERRMLNLLLDLDSRPSALQLWHRLQQAHHRFQQLPQRCDTIFDRLRQLDILGNGTRRLR